MRRLVFVAFALLALLAAVPASAAPRWLEPELPFGHASAGLAGAAMAPDGTVIVARVTGDGDLEIRERPPGGRFGQPIGLGTATEPFREAEQLQVLTAADGSAAVAMASGDLRFASVRKPGEPWTRPDESATAPGPVALAPGGALWAVGRTTTTEHIAAYRLVGDGPPSLVLLPRSPGTNHTLSGLSVSSDGVAHVAFIDVETNPTTCVIRSRLRALDITSEGDAGPPQTLDEVQAGGGAAPGCVATEGSSLTTQPVISSGADGSTTVAWTRTAVGGQTATLARHREPGAPWAVAGPPEELGAGMAVQQLLGGPGDPLLILSSESGRTFSTRPADGRWTTGRPLDEGAQATRTGTGAVVFASIDGANVKGRLLDPVTGLGEPATIAPAAPTDAVLAAGADDQGNALTLTSQRSGDADEVRLYGFDGAGPRVTDLAVPERAQTGTADRFSVEGVDVWSGPARSASWDFGDGTVDDGFSPAHAFATAGPRTVTVHLRDADGNESRASAPLDVVDAPLPSPPAPVPPAPPVTPQPPRDLRAPRLSRVSFTARAGQLQLTLDERGRARIVLTKQARGIRRGKRCVAPTRAAGKRCTRALARRTLTKSVAAGAQRINLPRLSAGTWKAQVVVTDAAGNVSQPRTISIQVTPDDLPSPPRADHVPHARAGGLGRPPLAGPGTPLRQHDPRSRHRLDDP